MLLCFLTNLSVVFCMNSEEGFCTRQRRCTEVNNKTCTLKSEKTNNTPFTVASLTYLFNLRTSQIYFAFIYVQIYWNLWIYAQIYVQRVYIYGVHWTGWSTKYTTGWSVRSLSTYTRFNCLDVQTKQRTCWNKVQMELKRERISNGNKAVQDKESHETGYPEILRVYTPSGMPIQLFIVPTETVTEM